jgi:hypothetical protein
MDRMLLFTSIVFTAVPVAHAAVPAVVAHAFSDPAKHGSTALRAAHRDELITFNFNRSKLPLYSLQRNARLALLASAGARLSGEQKDPAMAVPFDRVNAYDFRIGVPEFRDRECRHTFGIDSGCGHQSPPWSSPPGWNAQAVPHWTQHRWMTPRLAVKALTTALLAYNRHRCRSFPSEFWNPLAKAWLTRKQLALLDLARKIGLEDGGPRQAQLLQAILLQETIAGQLGRIGDLAAPAGKRSYGVMQVKVAAARDVFRWHPELGTLRTDKEIINKLMNDDAFNIKVASLFLKSLRRRAKSEARALLAYNIGMRAALAVEKPDRYKYVKGAHLYLARVVEPLNADVQASCSYLATPELPPTERVSISQSIAAARSGATH